MKILDVILKEQANKPIIQGTNWTKTWLDWDELPTEVVRNNPKAYSDTKGTLLPNAVEVAKTNLDAWRRANPGKFPEEAWTYLKGKGPIPTPSKEMPGRDLRTQPPDDSGTWIDSGNYWTHTIPPFIFAIKPDNRNPATWGPLSGNTSYVPVEKQIEQFRTENPKITDQEIEAKLRALAGTGTVGGKMYSNREIVAGIEKARTILAFKNKETQDEKEAKEIAKKAEKERAEQIKANKQFKKNKTCPIGFQVNDDEDGCERVPPPEGEQPPAPAPAPAPATADPTKPVNGACGAGYKLSADKTKCEKDETVTTPAGNASMIWPAGNKKLLTDKFGARDGKHRGIDIQLPYGSKIVAPEDGTVIAEGIQEGLAGLLIQLKSKDGRRVHTFMHLSVSSPVGKSATQGQFIAESGGEKREYTKKGKDGKDLIGKDGKPVIVLEKDDKRAGLTTGAHLHWGLEVDGVYVNPLDYVDKK
jgi:murein DD-endopeptidase MepM/ murein hydrolase activator NlpD